jgi:hypothetical protein
MQAVTVVPGTAGSAKLGALLTVVPLPVDRPTSCVFGGPDRSTLFVTTARHGLDDEALVPAATRRARVPDRGSRGPGGALRPPTVDGPSRSGWSRSDEGVTVGAGGAVGTARQGSQAVLLTLAAGQFLMTLDSSVMNVSIATVAKDVGGR